MKLQTEEGVVEIQIKELEGTDLGVLREFVNKHKLRGAVLIYQDDEGLNAVQWTRQGSAKLRNLWKTIKRIL